MNDMQAVGLDTHLFPLDNPQWKSACDYAHRYGTEPPQFAHAMKVATFDPITTFVAGTAGITASETRHPNDHSPAFVAAF